MDFSILYDIVISDIKLIILAVACVIIDFILGFAKAIINKSVESSKLRNGLYKLLLYTAFTILFILIQWVFPSALEWNIGSVNFSLSMIALIIICFTEIISIGENSKQIPLLYALITTVSNKIKSIIPIKSSDAENKSE